MSKTSSRVVSKLSPTVPQSRLNPQFIGISHKYSEHHNSRIESDISYKQTTSNYNFAQKFNEDLAKTIHDKNVELQRLRKIHDEHQQHRRQKLRKQDLYNNMLHDLRTKCQQDRRSRKKHIQSAQKSVLIDKYARKVNTKIQINNALFESQERCSRQFQQKCMRHKSIQIGKKQGTQHINQFYKTQNLKALNNYKQMIKQQNKRSQKNSQQIKKMHKKMQVIQKSIGSKQQKLKNIVDEINLYSVETARQRKVNNLMNMTISTWGYGIESGETADVEHTNSKIKRNGRKNRQRADTASSHRSRPSEILKKSMRQDREKYNPIMGAIHKSSEPEDNSEVIQNNRNSEGEDNR